MTRADRIRRRLLGADWPPVPQPRRFDPTTTGRLSSAAFTVPARPRAQQVVDQLIGLCVELDEHREALRTIRELPNVPASDAERVHVAVQVAGEALTCPCQRRGPVSGPIRHHRGCEHRPARPSAAEGRAR